MEHRPLTSVRSNGRCGVTVLRGGASMTVVFRSAKERPFAERKATMQQLFLRRSSPHADAARCGNRTSIVVPAPGSLRAVSVPP